MVKVISRFAVFAAASVLGLIQVPAIAQTGPDAREFAKEAMEQLQAAMPEATFEMEPGEPLQINIANTPQFDEGAINLHRIFEYCRTVSEADCQAELDQLILAFSQEPEPQGPANLRIIVRDAEYWGYVVEALGSDGLPQHRQIGDDLFAILAVDSPQSIALAVPGTVSDFGLQPDEAWEIAAQQTRAAIAPLPAATSYAEKVHAFEGEEYVSSLLFDVEAWAEIAAAVGPDLMITAATDQFVFTAAMPDGKSLDEFKKFVAEDCMSAARCISPNVYRFRNGRWVIAH